MNEPCYYRVSIKGIVIDDMGRILLARESDGTWDMLGGGLDHDEDPIAGLKREIQEETGLRVTKIWPEPKYFVTAYKASHNVYIANVVYQIELADLNFTPSDECQELRFVRFDEMRELQLPVNMQKLLEMNSLAQIAGCVLKKDDMYLLVQEKNPKVYGKWNLPAGYVDADETPVQAAIREVQEETGLIVEAKKEIFTEQLLDAGREFHIFSADIMSGELRPQPDEILDAQWFSMEDIYRLQKDQKLRSDWMVRAIESN